MGRQEVAILVFMASRPSQVIKMSGVACNLGQLTVRWSVPQSAWSCVSSEGGREVRDVVVVVGDGVITRR